MGGTSSLVNVASFEFFSLAEPVTVVGPEARNFALSSLKISTICLDIMLRQCFSTMIFLLQMLRLS